MRLSYLKKDWKPLNYIDNVAVEEQALTLLWALTFYPGDNVSKYE